jgi:hypothetical protein
VKGCHPALGSIESCKSGIGRIVGCYIENEASRDHEDFELVYELDLEGKKGRGIFVRIADWEVIEAVVAE